MPTRRAFLRTLAAAATVSAAPARKLNFLVLLADDMGSPTRDAMAAISTSTSTDWPPVVSASRNGRGQKQPDPRTWASSASTGFGLTGLCIAAERN